ncbi:MAG: two-component sensor histidine kinase, partial [Bacteroidetes bacterium]|nr:two-component sensor histidine kinase [Bacteroidota bacterium]
NTKTLFIRYYLPIFLVFSISVLAFQYEREKRYKADVLDMRLEDTNAAIFYFLEHSEGSLNHLDSLIKNSTFKDERITIIDLSGRVVYDDVARDVAKMDNHLSRKEVMEARKKGSGSDIRMSKTNNKPYYYHATRFGNCYVRSSLPYNMTISSLLSPDNLFLYFWLVLTFIIVGVLFYFSNRFTIKMRHEQAEQNSLVRRKLTQQVAHELKTPLSSIIGYMETLYNNPDITPERRDFFIKRSHSQAVRLNQLLQDVLLLNQMNEAPHSIEMEPVSINKIVENVTDDLDIILHEKNITIDTSFGGDVWLRGNQMIIYSIFRNLVDNSIAYAGKNIKINIALTGEDDRFYHFSYSDNGSGVSPEHLPYLFDRFYRVDKGRSRKTGGTGLGLSIVKNGVETHSGTISVHNKSTGGLEFVFSLHK